MQKKSDEEIRQAINSINWDFADYSSMKYPLDINSIPWYPASFPAPIPKYLTALLSDSEAVVFDPFGGKATTAVEALKQRRKFVYNDLNPHAVSIMECTVQALSQPGPETDFLKLVQKDKDYINRGSIIVEHTNYKGKKEKNITSRLSVTILDSLSQSGIQRDVMYWFHADTLAELLHIHNYIKRFKGYKLGIRKLAFISILKDVCSQRGHFSYVTDNCKPDEMRYYNAYKAYLEMLERIQMACIDFTRQYKVINKKTDLKRISKMCIIHSGDASDCSFLADQSVDLVITSPPYLCAQDYILTMRLNDFFFPDEGFKSLPLHELGPRRLRTRPNIVESYFLEMKKVGDEIYRVLKNNSYYCLIIGQGKGKVSKGIDVVGKIVDTFLACGFEEIAHTNRAISYRTNRIGGVDKEDILIFKKGNNVINN